MNKISQLLHRQGLTAKHLTEKLWGKGVGLSYSEVLSYLRADSLDYGKIEYWKAISEVLAEWKICYPLFDDVIFPEEDEF